MNLLGAPAANAPAELTNAVAVEMASLIGMALLADEMGDGDNNQGQLNPSCG